MFYYLQPEAGYLRITGPHQVDFLQRQTTNDVKSLTSGRAILTVLTTPMARILDVFYLFLDETSEHPEPAIGVLCLPGRAASTFAYLKGRIFFMDRVTVQDASLQFLQVDLFGPRAGAALHKLGLSIPAQPGEILQVAFAEARLIVLGHLPSFGLGYRLLFPPEKVKTLLAALEQAGARRVEQWAFELYRVQAGLPGAAGELTQEYTPLEVNLQAAVSDQKGCYTGQEVIARQITYDKVTRQLVGLRLEAEAQTGAPIFSDGKPAGTVTSVAISPTYGPIALAVIRRPFHQPGVEVQVMQDERAITAIVVALPF